MGFEEPTPIQEKTIPPALEGKDLIGQAQTGTGKTAAFGIPIINKVMTRPEGLQAVVLAPTRELAIQVAEELNRISDKSEIHCLPIYGGQDITRQIRALKKKPQIIVATPGRLMDHMRRKTIRLQEIQVLVLDEADEMLNMGFYEDVEKIMEETPKQKQILLFSATMPRQIQNLANRFMNEPLLITIKAKEVTIPLVEQHYIEVQERDKFDILCRLIDIQSPELSIVFGRTKRRVDELTEALKKRGYFAEGIHGDLTQGKRDSVLRQFRSGTVDILVATDVAARGLDITGVTHVYNFDIPQDSESYVHRIGRTGRAGQSGIAISFAIPRELEHLRSIERATNRKIMRMAIPTITEAAEGQQRLAVEKVLRTVEKSELQNYRSMAKELLGREDSVTLLSAALKLLTKDTDQTPITLSPEAPLRVRGQRNPRGRSDRQARQSQGQGKGKGFGKSFNKYYGKKDRPNRQQPSYH
ncbi:DEAD/DEAH box helicase [Heliorestis acidaminivorans]|uniref:ATP-dependent RNA helicase CshA n=2 Tax=Heliorestis acidaminivorans TaxID=553427 RepID=A0A6I0F3D5_9FIRM|nr:DEAD/DEAH box helicase [Heliorestis acidaminivorans]KAB2953116.1 DEAD/DEAH box helicase [Heliorestis acidaminivorans]